MVKAKIGSGPEEIGAIIPSEASPLGPMSFALGKEEKDLSPGSIESRFILKVKELKLFPFPVIPLKIRA